MIHFRVEHKSGTKSPVAPWHKSTHMYVKRDFCLVFSSSEELKLQLVAKLLRKTYFINQTSNS